MPLFAWKSEYSVKVELLDRHHQKLFSLLNQIYEMTMNSKEDVDAFSIISELREYTGYHFKAEERYMRDIGFSETNDHIIRHLEFTDRIEELYSQYKDNDPEVTRNLIVVIGNWLLHHVLKEDSTYSKTTRG